MSQWEYSVQLWDGTNLLISTVHKGFTSAWMEYEACALRIKRGEATRIIFEKIPERTTR